MNTKEKLLSNLLKKANKALWFTDVHMKPSNYGRCKELFELIIDKAKDVDLVIFTGDMHDGKDNISVRCQNLLVDFVNRLNKPLILLPGNHDYEVTIKPYHYASDIGFPNHSLDIFKDMDDVWVISNSIKLNRFVFIPYVGYNQAMLNALSDSEKGDFLFCHEGIMGADLGNGYLDDFSLPQKEYRKFKRVFTGHYHAYHEINNIIYLGSPFTQNFGEANQKKFIGIIDMKNGKVELIPTDMEQHMSVIIDADKEDAIFEKFDKSLDTEYLRVVLTGKKENVSKLSKDLKLHNLKNAKVIVRSTIQQKGRLGIDEAMTEDSMISKYIDNLKTDLDKEKLTNMAIEITKESKNASL